MTIGQKMKAEEKAKEIEKLFNLKEKKRPNSSGNFYTSVCANEKEELFILKIINSEEKTIEEKFINEIKTHTTFQNQKLKIDLPEMVSFDTSSKPIWFLYKYIDGETLGIWHKFKNTENLIENIFQIPEEISKIKPASEILSSLPDKTEEAEEKLIKLLQKNYLAKLIDVEKLKKDFYLAKKEVSAGNKEKVLVHGDLTPSNIILKPEKKIAVIDWYEVGLGHSAYDFAFLWLMLWNKTDRQKEFQEKFIKNNTQEKADMLGAHIHLLKPKMILILTDLLDNLERLKDIERSADRNEAEINNFTNGILLLATLK